MKLCEGKISGFYQVREVLVDEKIARRLQALGLTEGALLFLLNRKKSETIIIKVRGTRLALGSRITQGILVEEVFDGKKS